MGAGQGAGEQQIDRLILADNDATEELANGLDLVNKSPHACFSPACRTRPNRPPDCPCFPRICCHR
jgi:hypothetical protein